MKLASDLKMKLISKKPIKFGSDYIVQPTVDKVEDFGVELFDAIIYPFCMTKEAISIDESFKKDLTLFELLYLVSCQQGQVPFIALILDAIKFFFDTDDIFFPKAFPEIKNEKIQIDNLSVIINHRTVIDKDNFDDLADILLLISARQKVEVEEKKEIELDPNMSESARQRLADFKKLQEEQNRKDSEKIKDTLSIPNVSNIIANRDKKNPNYEKVMNFTIWQLYNSYKIGLFQDEFESIMGKANSGNFDMSKVPFKHWIENTNNLFKTQE